jgi:hypothetical protein
MSASVVEHSGNIDRCSPLYLARIEDLGRSDFVKVDWAACHHVALLSPEFLLRLGLSPQVEMLDLKERVRCRGRGARGWAVSAKRALDYATWAFGSARLPSARRPNINPVGYLGD